jgi:hypothetical protein
VSKEQLLCRDAGTTIVYFIVRFVHYIALCAAGINWFGAAFEHLWHVVFGQPAATSPARCIGTSCPVSLLRRQCAIDSLRLEQEDCKQGCRRWDTEEELSSVAGGNASSA